MQPFPLHRFVKRLPLFSLAAGAVVATVLILSSVLGQGISGTALGALGMLPLAAAVVDCIRLWTGGSKPVSVEGAESLQPPGEDELREWLDERESSLNLREQTLNTKALAIQQALQFPGAISLEANEGEPSAQTSESDDPLARYDEELFALIEDRTQRLFEDIKADAYRKGDEDAKTFDTDKIRGDVIALVSDVAAIYRPDETNPLLKTNVEAISRACGRASLRFLVAIESLPGGLSNYDFQSIYSVVSRAVATYGLYKSAKPYLDVASHMFFAGRIISTTNPVTLAAWWAAGKATTYGASRLGQHLIDQQAVGLIRQLVEIVAVEVASLYSPRLRHRDINWIYGVELAELASQLSLSPAARNEAMKQLASLRLRDEYGRIQLMRQLAAGKSARPDQYRPCDSLPAAHRMKVAEKLEAFMLKHVLNDPTSSSANKSAIDRWQTSAADRLGIQFRADKVDSSKQEQIEQCVWSLASFAIEHHGDEPDAAIKRIALTQCWNAADTKTHNDWIRELKENPPFIYHPPAIDPDAELCQTFLDDLADLSAGERPLAERDRDAEREPMRLDAWTGRLALPVTAYFLRADAKALIDRHRKQLATRLLGDRDASMHAAVPGLLEAIEYLSEGKPVGCVYSDATLQNESGESAAGIHVSRYESQIACFSVTAGESADWFELGIRADCPFASVTTKKVAGYVRSDCRISFPSGEVTVPGSSLRGYDTYFAALK